MSHEGVAASSYNPSLMIEIVQAISRDKILMAPAVGGGQSFNYVQISGSRGVRRWYFIVLGLDYEMQYSPTVR